MAIALRLFLIAMGVVILTLAVATHGMLPPPEVRTRIGDVPSLSRALLQQARVPPTPIDRLATADEPAAAVGESPHAMAASQSEWDRSAAAGSADATQSRAPAGVPTLAFAAERTGEEPAQEAPGGDAQAAKAAGVHSKAPELNGSSAAALQADSDKSGKKTSAKRKSGRRSSQSRRRAHRAADQKTIVKPADERKGADSTATVEHKTERANSPLPENIQLSPAATPSMNQTAIEDAAAANGPWLNPADLDR